MPYNSFDDYPMSWRPELERGKKPLYIALADLLEQDVASGVLKPGTKLPPQRELADFLDINLSTVTRAFKICAEKGILNSSMGSGTFISYHHTAVDLLPAERDIIDMGPIMPALKRMDEIRTIVQEMMQEPYFDEAFQYSEGTEYWQKEAGASLLSHVKCRISAEKIVCATGGQNAIAVILLALFKPGDRLGVDPLVYSGVIGLAQLFGIRLIPIEQENGEMSERGIRDAVKKDGIKGLYIIPNCQNPTAHCMSEACKEMIASVARQEDLIVIEDGFGALLTEDVKSPIYDRAQEQGIFLLSLSKSISPALRQAYIAIGDRYRERVMNVAYNINFEQSVFLQEVASRLILSGSFESLAARRKQILQARNRIADEIFKDYELWGGKNSLCRWLVLPKIFSSEEFERLAAQKNISVYGSEHFAVGKKIAASGVRLAIATPKDEELLRQALFSLREILQSR